MWFWIKGLECINKQIKVDFCYQQLSLIFNSCTIFQSNVPKIIYFRLFSKEILWKCSKMWNNYYIQSGKIVSVIDLIFKW